LDKKNGNRRVGVVSMRRAPSSAEAGRISGVVSLDIGKVIKSACRSFARAADWRQVSHGALQGRNGGVGGLGIGYRLSEDHEGLHSGRYINVSILRAANAVAIKGGYYDGYWQPRTVYKESVPLKELTAETLGCLLMEMHDRLCNGDRGQAT
jgi:hypothetical protein